MMTEAEDRLVVYQLKLAEKGLQDMIYYLRDTPFDYILAILEQLEKAQKQEGVLDETMIEMMTIHMNVMKELLKLQIKLNKETEGHNVKLTKRTIPDNKNVKWN